MASHDSSEGFGANTVILRSKARPEVSYKKGRRRAVAMPAYAWEVVVDVRERRGLHPLQRAVLGLMHCGVVEPDDLAHHLALLEPLIETVTKELVEMRLVSAKGALTKRGEERLEDDAMQPAVRFAFTDPWSGQVWPRVTARLDEAETAPGSEEDDFPALEMGTVGRPRTMKPFYVRAPQHHQRICSPPDRAGVTRALRRHSQAVGQFQRGQPTQFGKVHRIDERPIPVYIVADLYVPEAEEFEENWRVACPFGLGDLAWLRRHLDTQRKADPRDGGLDLTRVMSRLYGSGEPPTSRQALEVRVEELLTARVLNFRELLDSLVDLEATRLAITTGMEDGAKRRMVAHAARESGSTLETVLGAVTAQADFGLTPAMRDEVRLCGLSSALDQARQHLKQSELPAHWRDVRRVRTKADGPLGLDELLRLAVVCAASRQNHPLRAVFLADPELLEALQLTRRWRNQHSHGRRGRRARQRRWEDHQLKRCIDAVFTIVRAALPTLPLED